MEEEEDEPPPPLQLREDSKDEEDKQEHKDKFAHCRRKRKSCSIKSKRIYVKNIDTYKKEHPSVSNRTACGIFNLSESLCQAWAKRYRVEVEEEAPLIIVPPNNVAGC